MSSSGLVPPCWRSVRASQVTGNSPKVPLATFTRPRPLVRSPSQTASALLIAAMPYLPPRAALQDSCCGETAMKAHEISELDPQPRDAEGHGYIDFLASEKLSVGMAGLRSLAGGEIVEYTRLVEDTRRHAIDRMIENARAMGANAVVMKRFDSSEMGQTMTEVVAYGTAAIIERS